MHRSWRKIVFSFGVLVFLCLTVELAARALAPHTDKKPSRSPIDFQQIPEPVIEVDPAGSGLRLRLYVDSRNSLRYPKPKNALRAYAFGGSATMGVGFPHNGSFSRWLERMWRAAYPNREVEVVNLGRVGYSSEQVKVLVKEVLEKGEPDLLIVYSGHNEYLDLKARAALEQVGVPAPETISTGWLDRHSAALRFLRGLRPSKEKIPARIYHGYWSDRLNDRQIQAGLTRYENNLLEMAQAAKARHVPIVFCTLLANPLPTPFDNIFVDERWPEADKHQVSQAIGWARLQRWDRAEEALAAMSASAPRLKLLRIFEAGGIRGIDALSPAARRYLADAAPAVIRAITGSSAIRPKDYVLLALAYRLAGDEAALAATLRRLDEELHLHAGDNSLRIIRLLRAQFADAATYHRAFRELWESETGFTIAHPVFNETIRATARRGGASLVDVEQGLGDWLDPAPDHYLLDYCHLNIDGAFAVALLIFETVQKDHLLPPPEKSADFRAVLFKPDLAYLRTTGHDFLERDKYLGLNFRVCYVYAPQLPKQDNLTRWFAEDARRQRDRRVVDTLTQNFHYYQGR